MTSPRRPAYVPAEWRVPPAVVVGVDNITGLQTARILADRGVPVIGVAADRKHWGARTNACVDVLESPLAGEILEATLRELGRRLGRPGVLMPCTDPAVATLSRHRAKLVDRFALPLSPHDVVELLMDKAKFTQYAAATGLPVPRSEVLTTRADARRAAAELSFPCVLKPPYKSTAWLTHTGVKGLMIPDAGMLLSSYDRVAPWSPTLLLQEWVVGPESEQFTCNAYFGADGEPLVTFVTRKIRQWPPDIGTGCSGEECRNDEVLNATLAVFGDLRFHGFGYLEMKRDARTGQLMIIEPNVGRPTGRSATAEAAGIDLVYTAYCDAAGLPLPGSRRQRYVGTKWLDLRRDVQAVVVGRRRGTVTLGEWIRWLLHGRKAHAIWSRHDPAPFLVDLRQATLTGVRMLLSRHGIGRRLTGRPVGRTNTVTHGIRA